MHFGWGDEDRYQEEHPPDEGDHEEEDGEVAEEADGPEVVWGYLMLLVTCLYGHIMGLEG